MRNSSLLIGALFLLGSVFSSAAPAAQSTPTAAPSAPDSEYAKRIQRLEEQIVDLNAQIGTIESLAKGGGGAGGAGPADAAGAGGGDESRLGQMEMEVRALSAQVGDLVRRLQTIEARSGIVSPPQQPLGADRNDYAANGAGRRAPAQPVEQGTGFSVGGDGSASSGAGSSTSISGSGASSGNSVSASGGFSGSARIEPAPEPQPAPPPAKKKKSGGFLGLFGGDEEEETPPQKPAAQNLQPPSAQSRTSATGGGAPMRVATATSGTAKSMYDTAYTALMERNYRAAANGFEQFIQAYPTDHLAGSAHFWLGEASFTNGEYRKAADNFLKCATNFPQSEKAAESMLKLGISLKRLNEKDAACSSFNELARRYPDATAILQRAEAEKRRTGC